MQENEILFTLSCILQDPAVATELDQIADRVERIFHGSDEPLGWETVPIEIYRGSLPPGILSSWVFILREGLASGAERHPNSHQRVRAWRGIGDFQIWWEDRWESHLLHPRFDVPLGQQWASIPPNVWHQAVVEPGQHWIVVSFHTVPDRELIEERPDSSDANRLQQKLYIGK